MRKRTLMAWLLIVTAALFIGGCSSSDDDGPSGPSNDTPEYEGAATVDLPDGMVNSDDAMAAQAVFWVNFANGFTNHSTWLEPRGGFRDTGDSWTQTWSDGSLTITLIVEELASMYTWDVYITGTDGEETFDDYHFYHAWEDKDGLCGGLTFYAFDGQGEMNWEWCTETDGSYWLDLEFTDGSDTILIEVEVNPDGSGSLTFSENGEDTFMVTWDALGNGEWWTWEGGVLTGNDTWTVTLN